MYKSGDLVLYGSTGVCRVTEVASRRIPGADHDQLYYILSPLYQACVISVPTDNTSLFMRPILSKGEAERLIDMIPRLQVKSYHSRVIRELTEHYEASLKTHDCRDLINLTMSIYLKRQEAEQNGKKLGAVDERYMKRAEELLFGELAAALGIPKESVQDYIADQISAKVNRRA